MSTYFYRHPQSSEAIPHLPRKHLATAKRFNHPFKIITPQKKRPIYTNQLHNNTHSHQNNATKTYQGFIGLKLFLPDGGDASKIKLVCSFHVTNIFSLESPIKELVVHIKLVSSRSFDAHCSC